MDGISYRDFDLRIQRTGEGYRAQVLGSPAGEASSDFPWPFSELELENFLLRIGQRRRSTRRIKSAELDAAKAFGGRLFDAICANDVRDCLRSSLSVADQPGAGLRIRLRLENVPELTDVPWEYLYDRGHSEFFVLSQKTPLVRYLVTANLFPHEGIVLWIGSSYAEALFLTR